MKRVVFICLHYAGHLEHIGFVSVAAIETFHLERLFYGCQVMLLVVGCVAILSETRNVRNYHRRHK